MTEQLLRPYVPRLVAAWLRDQPETAHRSVTGTAVFADISGFTNLTERLAQRGKAGVEEMGEVLDLIFGQLLDAAYAYGADFIKWGGDAVLLLFDGPDHAARACRSAWEMQRVIARIGRVRTGSGQAHLRMSVGIHTGEFDLFLVGRRFREFVVTGPALTEITHMEKVANATEIVVSDATAGAIGVPTDQLTARDPGFLLGRPPEADRVAAPQAGVTDDTFPDLAGVFSEPVRDYLMSGLVEIEHRTATVAFVRVSGADALLANQGAAALTDAVATFITLCQDAASDHGITFLSSDLYADGPKLILVSGVPRSSGDDEARVLSAARHIVDTGCPLPIHVGVHVGRLIAGEVGPPYRRVFSITGDMVNLAARLMSYAEPNQIVATGVVLDRSRTRFDRDRLPPLTLKGKSEPVHAAVVGPPMGDRPHHGPSNERPQAPLVGRDDEIATLRAARSAATRGDGRVVEVVGPPGIGKTRLIEELASGTDERVIWIDGDHYGSSSPYQPMRNLFRPPPDVWSVLRERAPDLEPWFPLVGMVAGVSLEPTQAVADLDPRYRRQQLESATSRSLGTLLDEPTTLVFNDAHFMDEASRDLIIKLSADAKERRWLVVVASRDIPGGPLDIPGATRLDVGPLSPQAAQAYLEAATREAPLLPHQRAALIDRCGGNPLFLESLVSSAHAIDELPDTVEGVVAAGIDRLDPRQRALLRTAAVLGGSVDRDVLSRVLEIDGRAGRLESDLGALTEFLTIDDGRLRFTHDLYRAVAYEGLSFRRRAALHGYAADALAEVDPDGRDHADLLSLHCLRGERFESAWNYARQAADRAREVYAVADAAVLYRRALEAADHLRDLDPNARADTLEALADTCDTLGEHSNAEAALTRARKLQHRDPIRTAGLDLKMSTARERVGRYANALRWLTLGLRRLEREPGLEASRVRADLLARYSRIRTLQGHMRDVQRLAREGIVEAQRAGHLTAESHCLQYLDWAEMALGENTDNPPAERALAIYVELGDFYGQAGTHNTLGARNFYLGRWDEAVGHYRAAEEAYERCGAMLGVAVPMASRGEILSDQGRYEEAKEVLERALDILRAAGMDADTGFVKYLLGRLFARTNNPEQAIELLADASTTCNRSGRAAEVFLIDVLMAEARLLTGDADAALAAIDTALTKHVDGTAAFESLVWRVRGVAKAKLGDRLAARHDLVRGLELAAKVSARHDEAFALRALLETDLADTDTEKQRWRADYRRLATSLGFVQTQA